MQSSSGDRDEPVIGIDLGTTNSAAAVRPLSHLMGSCIVAGQSLV